MKFLYKVLCFLPVLVLAAHYNTLYSQNPRSPQVFAYNIKKSPTIGFKGGALLSTVTGDEAIDQFAKKISVQIGVTGAVYLHPMLSFRGELNYESKGGKFANHDMKMNLNYITLPLYLKFNFTRDPEIYIYGGGYAAYLFMANTKGTYEKLLEPDPVSKTINEDISPYLNKFDAGYTLGAGVQGRYNRSIDIFLDFRYSRGLVNLDNGSATNRYNFNDEELYFWPEKAVDKPKNKSIMLTTGIIFFLTPR